MIGLNGMVGCGARILSGAEDSYHSSLVQNRLGSSLDPIEF